MAERSLRGMSIGAKSLESDDNVDFTEDELKTLLDKRLQMHRDGWIPDYE